MTPPAVEAGRVAIDGGAAHQRGARPAALAPTVELPVVARALSQVAPDLPAPQQPGAAALPLLDAPCQPLLHLQTLRCWSWRKHRGYGVISPERYYDVGYLNQRELEEVCGQ